MLTTCFTKMNLPLIEAGDIITPRYIMDYQKCLYLDNVLKVKYNNNNIKI